MQFRLKQQRLQVLLCICSTHKIKRPDFRPAFVVIRFKRLHPDAQKCDEPLGVAVQTASRAKPLCQP